MTSNRPDLSGTSRKVVEYILHLEEQIEKLNKSSRSQSENSRHDLAPIGSREPPTTTNMITATSGWILKRTPRHEYSRQRRGGMGVFDIETSESQTPALITLADENSTLLLATSNGRVFQIPVKQIPPSDLRSRGIRIDDKFPLKSGEYLASIVPVQAEGYLAVLSKSGMIRTLRHHVFGEYMKPGTNLYDPKSFGKLANISWAPGDGYLFLITRSGKATRFSEKLVPPQGCLGIRVADGDQAIGVTPVYDDSGVLLIGADGKGTIRLMEGFAANKSPGAGGKVAMNTDALISAITTDHAKDVFIISKTGKIIRFSLDEIPPKTGVVQGVNCMTFRADEAVYAAIEYSNSLF
jgi:DNA gyrase subunit A